MRCNQTHFVAKLEHHLVLEGKVREGTRVRAAFNPEAVHYMEISA